MIRVIVQDYQLRNTPGRRVVEVNDRGDIRPIASDYQYPDRDLAEIGMSYAALRGIPFVDAVLLERAA